jgi:hypothetical protein
MKERRNGIKSGETAKAKTRNQIGLSTRNTARCAKYRAEELKTVDWFRLRV